jgi:transcriptional regulator with XRE-family HTH domain
MDTKEYQSVRNPNYVERVQRNLRRVVEENGGQFYKGTARVTARQMYRIEAGESFPTIITLQKIADDLKFDMIEFLK